MFDKALFTSLQFGTIWNVSGWTPRQHGFLVYMICGIFLDLACNSEDNALKHPTNDMNPPYP